MLDFAVHLFGFRRVGVHLYIYLSQEGNKDGKNFRPELGNRNYSIDQRIY